LSSCFFHCYGRFKLISYESFTLISKLKSHT
jgi:hypothetical protein